MTQQTNIESLTQIITEALEDIKAKNIVQIETEKLTSLFNRMIVASGDSHRQVKALARNVAEEVKKAGFEIISIEGMESGEWVLVDAADIVVHIMLPAVRDYYDIEALWGGEKPSLHPEDIKPWSILD